jgi:hypothetical protein
MRTLVAAPDQVVYYCDCCKRRFPSPSSRKKLGLGDRFSVLGSALGQTLRLRGGLRSGYRTLRPRLLARRNDEEFEAFAATFNLCGGCRGFICRKCWKSKARLCRACARRGARVATAPGPDGGPATHPAGTAFPSLSFTRPPDRPHRPTFGLGALLRPGRIRTLTSVCLMVFALLLGAAEAAYVMAAPR